ncbi:hypothetical protein KW797_01660 [Candidatus Parcubacteria bacterium]|nr:hypothetical protein [Candidatus Parcubacteria bacterium]
MARTLQERVIAALGLRKALRYFPDPDAPTDSVDTDIIDEFVGGGLRQLAETAPFPVTETNFVLDTYGRLAVDPTGPQAPRRLGVNSVFHVPTVGPVCQLHESTVRVDEGTSIRSPGWFYEAGFVWITHGGSRSSSNWINFTYPTGSIFNISFRVVPSESEIAALPSYMRAASLFATASALEEILSSSTRESTIRLEGVPDIRDTRETLQQEILFLQKRARALLGDFQAIL